MAILNVAASGKFSSDRTIAECATEERERETVTRPVTSRESD